MPRLRGTNAAEDVTVNDIPLTLVRGPYANNKPAMVRTSLTPLKSGTDEFQTVVWQNGKAGAGWTRETPASAQGGGYSHGENVTTLTPGIVMPSGKIEEITLPAGVTTALYDAEVYDSDLWVSTGGRYLANVTNATGTSAVIGADLGSGYTSNSLHVFDGNLIVSGAGSGSIWKFDGATFTQGTGVTRSRLDSVYWTVGGQTASGGSAGTEGTGAFRLLATNTSGTGFYHLASGADPLTAANWSSLIPVTSSVYPIQSIVAANRTAWFSTPAGVIAVDGLGYAPNITPWAQRFYNASSGAAVMYHDGYVLYGHRHGLALVPTTGERQDTPVWLQFGDGTANGTPIYGRPYCIDTAGSCVYVAYGDAGSTYIMALRITSDGPIWSGSERTIPGEQPTMLRVMDLGGRPYLVIGTTDTGGTPHLYRQSLPLTGSPYGDYLQNTAHEFETDWSITLSKWDLNDSAPKEVHQYEIITENLGDSKSVTVNVSTDGAAYVTQGAASVSPRQVILPETDASAGTDVQIRLNGTNPSDDPIVLRMVGARMSVQPEPIESIDYTFIIRDEGEELRNTAIKRGRNAKADFRAVLALPRQGTVTVSDQFGDTMRGRVRSIMQADVHEEAKGKPWTAIVQMRFVVIERIVRYDDGDLWDSGLTYGAS